MAAPPFTPVDASGNILRGGSVFTSSTAKTLTATTAAANIVAANTSRSDFYFVNNSTSIAVWANEFGTAVAGSAGQRVPAGATFIASSTGAVSVIAESSTVFCSGAEA